MKRLSILAAFALCLLSLSAQKETAIKFVLEHNQKAPAFASSFTQQNYDPVLKKTADLAGALYFQAPARMSMIYTTPATDRFIVCDRQLYMVRGAKKTRCNLDKVRMMASLADLLTHSMMGHIEQIATDTRSDISYSADKEAHIFVFRKAKKEAKGYKEVELHYSRKDGHLVYMKLTELSGRTSTYRMTAYKPGHVPADRFAIPAK